MPGGELPFHYCFFFGWLVVWKLQLEDPLHQHLGVAVEVQRVLVVDDWVIGVWIQEHRHVASSGAHLWESVHVCETSIHPSILRSVFIQPTHCEYVSMFALHPAQELGSISSKFKRVSQPWDQSLVQRRLLLGPKVEKVEIKMQKNHCIQPFISISNEGGSIQRTPTRVWKGFVWSFTL